MRKLPSLLLRRLVRHASYRRGPNKRPPKGSSPILDIENAVFYREHPSATPPNTAANPAMFENLSFAIPSEMQKQQHWAVIGPSNAGKTTLLEIIRGKHFCLPPTARLYPHLASEEIEQIDFSFRNPARAIQYVGFEGERGGVGKAGTRGAYLSSRYESRIEDTDFSVMDYLKGNIDLNPVDDLEGKDISGESLSKVIADLSLETLVGMPMRNLSNGQTRRARIAKALLGKPLVLLLDEPFMGLDPPTITALNPLLYNLSKSSSPRLILALRPQDPLPDWVTHIVYLSPGFRVSHNGGRKTVYKALRSDGENHMQDVWTVPAGAIAQRGLPQFTNLGWKSIKAKYSTSRDGLPLGEPEDVHQSSEPLVEMQGVCVKYDGKPALGAWSQELDGKEREGLWWTVRRGERWGIFGPNGSGKTTLLSLICSDHPQAYSLPIKVFGRGRLPQQGKPGISIFDVQARIGQSSPEIHAFFPRNLSIRQTIENAWADTFLGKPRLTYENNLAVDSCLSWFEAELNPTFIPENTPSPRYQTHTEGKERGFGSRTTEWADKIRFREIPFSAQRVALFLRAIVKKPDLVVLDEAFSGMDPSVRDKCMLFLTWGETKSFGITIRNHKETERFVMDTETKILSQNVFTGLSQDQALLCVSHVRNEVPGVVRDWMSLPEATENKAARFGKFEVPLEKDVKKTSLSQHLPETNFTTQHGVDRTDSQPTHQLHAGAARQKARSSTSSASSTRSSSQSSTQSLEQSLRRLRKSSPVDRIAEHEKALTHLSKRRSPGPTFTVVQGDSSATIDRVLLTDFPNEVLTHILSHLPPSSLSDVSLVSKRFHQLVTTPHAWRIAFSRFFPGSDALSPLETPLEDLGGHEKLYPERRLFTRLTALASWRSEYILRTRLLWSLSRGKPSDNLSSHASASSRSGTSNTGSAHITYNSDLITVVDHLQATFGNGSNKKLPRFIHGATEIGMATVSDPRVGKVEQWGLTDAFAPLHFQDLYPGDAMFGLGSSEMIGIPNSMDISQLHGMIYAEGLPTGRAYYRSTEEKRGRVLAPPLEHPLPELGIPSVSPLQALTSVCIAKTPVIPELSEGLAGILVGSSQGVISLYSLGTSPLRERRIERGELTARWTLSPGVPIIAIAVDERHSSKRKSNNRLWAVALNALGEVFYLSKFPVRRMLDRALKLDDLSLERLAWETGRTVYWNLVSSSVRTFKPDPFNDAQVDGISSPRSSWNEMGLSKEQIIAETQAINALLQKKPNYFIKTYQGWDMRRRMEIDFAGNDENGAGESIVIISCALSDSEQAAVKRYTRCLLEELENMSVASVGQLADVHRQQKFESSDIAESQTHQLISSNAVSEQPSWSFQKLNQSRRSSVFQPDVLEMTEEWRTSTFMLDGLRSPQITTSAIDQSDLSLLTTGEDPLLSMNASSTMSSPASSPLSKIPRLNSLGDIPGRRARLFGVGTTSGTIMLWDIRAPVAKTAVMENSIKAIRVIHTASPQISCLALTALYLVHGGNDGLVQAWDPLASNTGPIRTLNSRFSSRARRRLMQAEASTAGVGVNLFAAGAICLDSDTTVLRGMVSLGSHLRYWSYSSQAADVYKGNKRRLRRSERGSNQAADRFSGTGRGALKDYIANEKLELEREKRIKRKEDNKLSARYGVDLLGPGATEDELLAYATLLSEESAKVDEQRRKSASEDSSSETITEEAVTSSVSSTQDEVDEDVAEAIRLSLQESNGFRASSLGDGDASASSFSLRYAKSKRSSPSRSPPREGMSKSNTSPKTPIAIQDSLPEAEMDDLQFALQLSQAEEESRAAKEPRNEKGKGRAV
ncbi:hypothetical protein ACLMJK_003614 [Lecanora helva]